MQYTGFKDKKRNGDLYDIAEGTMGRFLILYDLIVGEGYGFQWKPLANSNGKA